MPVPERGERARAWLAAHPQSTAALVDDRLWPGITGGTHADRDRPIPRLKTNGPITSAVLEPLRPNRTRDVGRWLIVWACLWGTIALISIPGLDDLGPYMLIPFAMLMLFQLLPGIIIYRRGKGDRRRIVPMRVERSTREPDGVHRVTIRDIDGSRYDILATELLALTLLLSSDFDGTPYESLQTGPDRVRPPEEMAMAPVLVDSLLLRGMYEPGALERQLLRAQQVAGITREELELRWKEAMTHHWQRALPTTHPSVSNQPNDTLSSWLNGFALVVEFPLIFVVAFLAAALLEG